MFRPAMAGWNIHVFRGRDTRLFGGRGFTRSFGNFRDGPCNSLGCAAFATVRKIFVNNAALGRLVEARREKTQFYAGFCDIARSNCNLHLFLLPFQAGQNALIT